MTEITGKTSVKRGSIETYTAIPDNAHKFQWTIGGGKILRGQGTHQVKVDWMYAGPGSIELAVTSAEGDIDAIFICVEVIKTEKKSPVNRAVQVAA